MPGRGWVIGLLIAAALAGCGGAAQHPPGLSPAQSRALVAQLETARRAAAAGNVTATQAALARFKQQVAALRRAGRLSDATARQLRLGAARVLARVRSDSTPAPQPAPQTTPAPAPPTPLPPGQAKKHDKGPKPGKGHDHGHGPPGGDGGGD